MSQPAKKITESLQRLQQKFLGELDFQNIKSDPSHWPVWKVAAFSALASTEEKQLALPLLNRTQRKFLRNHQVWNRDEISLLEVEAYINELQNIVPSLLSNKDASKEQQVLEEFLQSEDFLLYLKAKYTISTFDPEFPDYPEHDHYFLTEDQSFIFIYELDLASEEIDLSVDRALLKSFYMIHGVEQAFQLLSQVIGESFMQQQELGHESTQKMNQELGWPNYYESLEVMAVYQSESAIRSRTSAIKKSLRQIGTTDIEDLPMKYFYKTLSYYWVGTGLLKHRRASSDALLASVQFVSACIKVGRECAESWEDIVLNDFYNYFELFKIGHSWYQLIKKDIAKATSTLEQRGKSSNFLGPNFYESVHIFTQESWEIKTKDLASFSFSSWWDHYHWIKEFLSLALPLSAQFNEHVQEFQIREELYVNYRVEEITIEEFFINSIMKFSLDKQKLEKLKGFGLWREEFEDFLKLVRMPSSKLQFEPSKLYPFFENYIAECKLSASKGWKLYFQQIFDYHLADLEYDSLKDEDFAHVGGVVLFHIKKAIKEIPQ